MEPSWSSEPWVIFMTLFMGAGAAIVTWITLKVFAQPRLPKDMARARDELEIGCRRIIRKNIELMEAVRDISIICKQLPPEYVPVALQVMKLAQVMEEAAFADGANANIFPRPMFNAAGEAPRPPMMPVKTEQQRAEEEAPPQSASRPQNVVPIHFQEINGQILRTG